MQGKKDTLTPMQFAQCCFDTEWCETRLSEDDLEKCNDIEWLVYMLLSIGMRILITLI